MNKITQIITLPIVAFSLAGCGEVMDSTANLIDAVTNNIENDQKEDTAPEVVIQEAEKQVAPSDPVAKEVAEPVQQVVTQQPAKQQNIVEKDSSGMTHVQVTAKDANIRAEPSLDASIILASKLNDTFSYLNEKVKTPDGRTWYKVETTNGVGYMSSVVGTLSTGNINKIVNVGSSTLTVRADEGNVRAEPSVNSKVIASVKGGEKLQYVGESLNASDGRLWHKVTINGNTGYISSLVAVDTQKYDNGKDSYHFIITSSEGNIRSEPSIDAPIIHTGKKNDQFRTFMQTVETSDGRIWHEVEFDNSVGYISSKVGRVR